MNVYNLSYELSCDKILFHSNINLFNLIHILKFTNVWHQSILMYHLAVYQNEGQYSNLNFDQMFIFVRNQAHSDCLNPKKRCRLAGTP